MPPPIAIRATMPTTIQGARRDRAGHGGGGVGVGRDGGGGTGCVGTPAVVVDVLTGGGDGSGGPVAAAGETVGIVALGGDPRTVVGIVAIPETTGAAATCAAGGAGVATDAAGGSVVAAAVAAAAAADGTASGRWAGLVAGAGTAVSAIGATSKSFVSSPRR